jgi:hypothetical protein
MKEYKAIDLYNGTVSNFTCPFCNKELKVQILMTPKNNSIVFCCNCRKKFSIYLPKLKKKLVYLDQWFVSNISDPAKYEYYTELIEKIEKLIGLQKVFVVTSDVHAKETSNIPEQRKQYKIWEKFNSLACGIIAKDTNDILLQQYKRILLKEREDFFWSDVLDKNPNEWIVGTRIISTHKWMLRLHNKCDPSYENVNNMFRSIIEQQISGIDSRSTPEECLKYIKKLWAEDIIEGIDYYKKFLYCMEHPETFFQTIINHKGQPISNAFVKPLVELCTHESNYSEKQIITLLEKTKKVPKKLAISDSLEAQKLHAALQTLLNGNSVTKNQKKFSVKYGVSSQNDISHISSFSPYADILITDDNARKRLEQPFVQKHLADLKCKFFSNNNIHDFDKLMDDLLNTKDNDEIKLTRMLLQNTTSNR